MYQSVILVSNFYPPKTVGGAEIVAHRQARMLRDAGWMVRVLAGRLPDEHELEGVVEFDEFEGIPIYRLSHRSLEPSDNFFWPLASRCLTSLISSYRPDWVHFHNPIGLGTELILRAKQAGSRVAVTLHDYWGFCLRNTRLRNNGEICEDAEECHQCLGTITTNAGVRLPVRFRRDYIAWCLNHADRLISPSRSLRDSYEDGLVEKVRIEVISNGIDLKNIKPRLRKPHRQIRFLCAAGLWPHKGIPYLLEAARLLTGNPDYRDRWTLTIAGHGHYAARIAQEIETGALGETVLFSGSLLRGELLETLSESDVVVLPSIWPENEPVIILEGIASGAAIVASEIGGLPELVENGVSGLLIPAGNPRALAQAMARFIDEPQLVAKFSERNLQRREEFNERRSFAQLESGFNAYPLTSQSTDHIVICAGGEPDAETATIINSVGKCLAAPRLRFIWYEWADRHAWLRASAFWWWAQKGGLLEVHDALRRGVPLIMREGEETANLKSAWPSISAYDNALQLMSSLRGLCRPISAEPTRALDIPVFRHFHQLRSRHSFFLRTTDER